VVAAGVDGEAQLADVVAGQGKMEARCREDRTLSKDGSTRVDMAPNATAPSKQRRVAATRGGSSSSLRMGKRSGGGSDLYGTRVGF
jgi:hypothetical protein